MDIGILIINILLLIGEIIFGFILYFGKSYTKKKAENIATKEDIAGITNEIKLVESKFINETEKLKSSLVLLTNIQTDIASIERNAIIDFNKSVFTFMYSVISGNIPSIADNKMLDGYIIKLNNLSEQVFASQILLDLFIKDNNLRNEANDVLINVLAMNNIKQIDILELENINEEINNIKNKSIDTTTNTVKRDMLSKVIERRKKHVAKMYEKQSQKYGEIKEQNWAFQDTCRLYIHKLLKPEQ